MVMIPPSQQGKRMKLRLELAWLNKKEKLFGKLSESDQKRKAQLLRELAIVY